VGPAGISLPGFPVSQGATAIDVGEPAGDGRLRAAAGSSRRRGPASVHPSGTGAHLR